MEIVMLSLLKIVLSAGLGLAGLGALTLYGVMESWLKLDVFSKMTSEQTYNAFIACLIAMFGSLLVLVIVHLRSSPNPSVSAVSHSSGHAINTTGKNSSVNINK